MILFAHFDHKKIKKDSIAYVFITCMLIGFNYVDASAQFATNSIQRKAMRSKCNSLLIYPHKEETIGDLSPEVK